MKGSFLLPLVSEDAELWADFYRQECLAAVNDMWPLWNECISERYNCSTLYVLTTD